MGVAAGRRGGAPLTVVLFAGDSVTDCGRTFFSADVGDGELGDGWVRIVASLLGARQPGAHRFLNAGVAGDRVGDLRDRWQRDVAAHDPEVLTVLVGVNDALIEPRTAPDEVEAAYRALVDAVPPSVTTLVLAEPFVLPVHDGAAELAAHLAPTIALVGGLAAASGARLLPLQQLFTDACSRADPTWWVPDGVHPSAAGHGLIAEAWLALTAL